MHRDILSHRSRYRVGVSVEGGSDARSNLTGMTTKKEAEGACWPRAMIPWAQYEETGNERGGMGEDVAGAGIATAGYSTPAGNQY